MVFTCCFLPVHYLLIFASVSGCLLIVLIMSITRLHENQTKPAHGLDWHRLWVWVCVCLSSALSRYNGLLTHTHTHTDKLMLCCCVCVRVCVCAETHSIKTSVCLWWCAAADLLLCLLWRCPRNTHIHTHTLSVHRPSSSVSDSDREPAAINLLSGSNNLGRGFKQRAGERGCLLRQRTRSQRFTVYLQSKCGPHVALCSYLLSSN